MANQTAISESVNIERVDTVTATLKEERTYRAIIETPRSGNYSVLVYREEVFRDADGNVLKVSQIGVPIHRLASAILSDTVDAHGIGTISGAMIMGALPLFFDKWALEDIEAGRR